MLYSLRAWMGLLLSVLWMAMLNIYWVFSWLPEFPYDCRRILQLVMLGLCVVWLCLDSQLRVAWLKFYQKLPIWAHSGILFFFAMGILSAYLAELPTFAFMQVGLYALLAISAGLLAALYDLHGETMTHILVGVLIAMVAIYEVYLLQSDIRIQFFGYVVPGGNSQMQELALVAPGFMQVRFLAQFLSWTLPLIVLPLLLYPHHSRWVRGFYVLVAAIWWYTMILNHSRGLWVECVLVSLSMALFFKGRAKDWFKWQLIAAALGTLIYVLLTWVLPLSLKQQPVTQAFYTDAMRTQIWWYTLKMLFHSPWLGIGPLHYAYHFRSSPWPAHPHNGILNIAVEWGIPAITVLLCLVGSAITHWALSKKAFRKQGYEKEILYMALTASFIAGCLDSLYSGTFVMPLSQVMLVIVGGSMLGLYHEGPTVGVHHTPNFYKHILFLLALGLAAVMLYGGVFSTVFRLPQITYNFIEKICIQEQLTCLLTPNFWLEGWIQFYASGR